MGALGIACIRSLLAGVAAVRATKIHKQSAGNG